MAPSYPLNAHGAPICRILRKGARRILALLTITFLTSAHAEPETASYRLRRVQGYTVRIAPSVQKEIESKTVALLSEKLAQVNRLLPAEVSERLQQVNFWIENTDANGSIVYHPAREWLIEHGKNADKAHGIELFNPKNFWAWATTDQPMMVLHELAHAWMFLALGENYLPLKIAWENAAQRQLYTAVPYIHGGLRRAYGLNNPAEFFAELSEAYFGKNDFFPFEREDLKIYDPIGFKLMEQAWNGGASGRDNPNLSQSY